MSSLLSEYNIDNIIAIAPEKWCSVAYMQELLLGSAIFPRKKTILILKIASWMTETKTGLLDELKFYGEERNMIDIFRSQSDEFSIWREHYEQKLQQTPVLITDIYSIRTTPIPIARYTIIKDISLIEDCMRRIESQEISFDILITAVESIISGPSSKETQIHISDMIGMIRGIYESIPSRPTGPLISPPGAYGETYFITQAMLWHTGFKWLVHATRTLDQLWKTWKSEHEINTQIREHQILMEYIESSIRTFSKYHSIGDNNTNVTINITNEKTKITYIPRSIQKNISPLLEDSLAYGINISLPQTEAFLEREYGYLKNEFGTVQTTSHPKKIITQIEYHPGVIQAGTVILTTSQKHARDLGQALRKIHGKNMEILIQGLSGGK